MIQDFDYAAILDDMELHSQYVEAINDRTALNADIAALFIQLFEETGKDRYFARSNAISTCGQMLFFDFHHKLKIADLLRISLCHDRFCPNCAKMRQVTMMERFIPCILALDDAGKDIYHMVLTAPNVPAAYLKSYTKIFYTAFYRFVRILRGTDKIFGLDLSPLEFAAALRNTEVTYGSKDYHLHLHVIIALARGLDLPQIYKNKFSYDYVFNPRTHRTERVFVRSFSALEIFFQKLWRLLVDQTTAHIYKFGLQFPDALPRSSPLYQVFADDSVLKKVATKKKGAITLNAVRAMGIDDGYSVILEPVANAHFTQVFKYAFKVVDDNDAFMSYANFKALEQGLHGAHLMQGYGLWRNMKCDESIDQGFDEFFDVFKAYLWQVDRPESVNLTPDEALTKMKEGEYTFITRSKLRSLLCEPSAQSLIQHKDELPLVPKRAPSFPDLGLAYSKYLHSKDQQALFASVNKITDPNSGKSLVLLSEQQLNFLQTIF